MNISGSPGPRTDIDQVLAQIRQMRAQTQQEIRADMATPDVALPRESTQVQGAGFGDLLGGALKQVNALQKASSQAASDYVTGKSNDLVGTMLASQKSSIAIQATTQVRNRVVSAYQDIMNMPI